MKLFPASYTGRTVEVYTARISAKSRIIYWIIILSLAAAIASLPFIYVDISVQARGLFQSAIEKQTISAPVSGRVATTVIHHGLRVAAGDTLLIVDSEGLEAKAGFLRSLISENDLCIADLVSLSRICPHEPVEIAEFMTPRYRSEYTSFKRNRELQEVKYLRARSDYARCSILFSQDIVAAAEYEKVMREYHLEETALQHMAAAQQSVWQSDLAYRIDQAKKLSADLEQLRDELDNRVIRSPVNGMIIQSADIQPGSFLIPGQKLAEISPFGGLLAVFHVSPTDIGFIREGQSVKLQIDAYNYHQWGMLDAVITGVSDDIITDGRTALYRVHCRPLGTTLSTGNAISARAGKGMTFTARVMVTRRSLFNLLFDKADKWLNPYHGKNSTYAGKS